MTELLKCRLAARCEAAGRPNNEDNYHIISDINIGNKFNGDEIFSINNKGTLLVVCDGMGGMNAGEVASDIAVKTINKWFDSAQITNDVLANDLTRCDYIKKAIQNADANIKNEGAKDESKRGMGSTIVMVWLLDGKAYVGWCGDSRAYKYNPKSGLMQMSHDHSYVQELVDSGKLSPELAFDHPNGNIITRSLGDPRGAAQPDVKIFQLEENDVILLCSDGLCGVLRNNEIENVVKNNTQSMNGCRDALWEAARNAEWHDNVTIVLAQIMPKDTTSSSTEQKTKKENQKTTDNKGNNKKKLLIIAGIILIAVVLSVILFGKTKHDTTTPDDMCNDSNLISLIDKFKDKDYLPQVDTQIFDQIKGNVNNIKKCPSLKNDVEYAIQNNLEKIDQLSSEEEKEELQNKYLDLKKQLQ